MKKFIILCLLLIITLSAFAAEIRYNTKATDFLISNRKNSKIYKYILLKPAESITGTLINIDTLEVFSRVVLNSDISANYKYDLTIDNEKLSIDKSAKVSKASRGVNGEVITTYNKFIKSVNQGKITFILSNISHYDLIFKISSGNLVSSNKEIDYIRFTPNFYGKEKILSVNQKEYTYYAPKSNKIQLTLEGPIILKIISRMIFNANYVNNSGYRYQIFDNRELFAEFSEKAYKSTSSWLKNEPDNTPSTGDVNIIKLAAGLHHITIEDNDDNRDLIFRFYINKNAVEIDKQ
ncbi:MAG: hypothetical protein K9N07_08885 [Candidatus Cloacimonetes bacterium]|nr:hypothetical protein [Candidatus Cloacimonadota bacterium]